MKRAILACVVVVIAAVAWFGVRCMSSVERPLTPEDIARLEPELCSSSPLIQLLTIVPMDMRSLTSSLSTEQLALIDQYKGTGWRKVWVLRLPAAFITHRTCDSGRKNWTGTGGDDLSVSQRYELSLILTEDDAVPATRAAPGKYDNGLPVVVWLRNSVMDPARRHQAYARSSIVNGRLDREHPPRCREEEGEIAGLVRFKRIDPNERGGMHCGRQSAQGTKWENRVFGRKIGDLTYEFIVNCSVNCTLDTDYHGWKIELMFPFQQLEHWPRMLDGISRLLDRHTAYLEHDDPNARR